MTSSGAPVLLSDQLETVVELVACLRTWVCRAWYGYNENRDTEV